MFVPHRDSERSCRLYTSSNARPRNTARPNARASRPANSKGANSAPIMNSVSIPNPGHVILCLSIQRLQRRSVSQVSASNCV